MYGSTDNNFLEGDIYVDIYIYIKMMVDVEDQEMTVRGEAALR